MSARASKHDQRALCALFALVTTDLPRSRISVTSGNAPRFAWATASVAARVGSCPTVCGGRRCGRCPCPTPLPIGSVASISIKGEGFARHRPPFGTRFAPFRMRPPVSPLTPIPAKTRLPMVTRTSWPGRRLVTSRLILNLRHWRQLFATWWRAASPSCVKD